MARKLAAILVADVAGYSRLSQIDEEGTRHRFQADLHENIEPLIAQHDGRLVKTMGDGLLVEFHSVVDALRCAIEIQKAQKTRNAGRSQERQLVFRVGINLGDVLVEGDDVHGDGVNIAARLQQLAEPSGIAISGTVYDQVKTKLGVGYGDLGERRVKNLAEPVRVYRVLLDPAIAGRTIRLVGAPTRGWRWPGVVTGALLLVVGGGAIFWLRPWEPRIEPASVERMLLPLPANPSVVVLPLANMSNDPNQEYFADGITDDLITELSKVDGLFVIARNSSFTYKGKSVKIAQVAEELGVRYVLEGSVQRAGERLRINAQLIDALSGGHVWADRFDGSLEDVFAFQDKVTRGTADALIVKLMTRDISSKQKKTATVQKKTATVQQASLPPQRETSVAASYDAFLRGWEHYRRATPEDYAKAIPHFEKAIKLDPEYSRAYAALSLVYVRSFGRGWSSSLGISDYEALDRTKKYLKQAQKQPIALGRQAAGYYLLERGLFNEALIEFKEAIALDPSDSWSYAFSAYALTSAGRPGEAMLYIRTATRLDPHPPPLFVYYLGVTQLGLGQFEDAASTLESAIRLNPGDQFGFSALGATYAHLGRKQDATAAIDRYNQLEVARGGIPLTLSWCPDCRLQAIEPLPNLEAGLRLAGVPEKLSHGTFAKQNRLSADKVRRLVFGHRLHGRSLQTGVERSAAVTTNGVATMSGDWVTGIFPLTGGVASLKGDDLCLEFATREYCGPVLRNPGGSRVNENEYIWHISEPFRFSVVQ